MHQKAISDPSELSGPTDDRNRQHKPECQQPAFACIRIWSGKNAVYAIAVPISANFNQDWRQMEWTKYQSSFLGHFFNFNFILLFYEPRYLIPSLD